MEENNKLKISTPTAIVVAGLFVAIALLLTKGGNFGSNSVSKTLSEQVGVNKDKFTQCLKETDLKALWEKTNANAMKAMSGVPAEQRGTPYSVIVGSNGVKAEIRGAYPKENVNALIAEVLAGKVTTAYTGEITGYEEGDHIVGDPNAPVVVVEYSDLECPYCKKFGATMKEIVAESNGQVAWIYRHWIVHTDTSKGQNALPKAAAAECVAKLNGNDAFWKYIDLVFGLMDPQETTSVTDNL
jgi:predicted DsbA family dithiol-disulfide isomerase